MKVRLFKFGSLSVTVERIIAWHNWLSASGALCRPTRARVAIDCPGQLAIGTVDQAFPTRYSVRAPKVERSVFFGLLAIAVEHGENRDAGADYHRNCGDEPFSVHEVLRSDLPSVSIISA